MYLINQTKTLSKSRYDYANVKVGVVRRGRIC